MSAEPAGSAAANGEAGPRVHNLKLWPEPFQAVWDGRKLYEVRTFDRDYRIGDEVYLYEFDPNAGAFSGRGICGRITYVTRPGTFGLPPNVGVFAFKELDKGRSTPEEAARYCDTPPLK